MSGNWQGSTRQTATASTAWKKLRLRILKRDGGVCYLCGQPGADTVDHIRPVHLGGTDDEVNLGSVHDRTPPHCHRAKTSAEAAAARRKTVRRRPVEPHPGLRNQQTPRG